MKRLHATIQEHWDPLIPPVALPPIMKSGDVTIEFAILKDGTVRAMKLVKSSGTIDLDRAAWSGITTSNPLAHLPAEFSGDYLLLRCTFRYNPSEKPEQTAPPDKK